MYSSFPCKVSYISENAVPSGLWFITYLALHLCAWEAAAAGRIAAEMKRLSFKKLLQLKRDYVGCIIQPFVEHLFQINLAA